MNNRTNELANRQPYNRAFLIRIDDDDKNDNNDMERNEDDSIRNISFLLGKTHLPIFRFLCKEQNKIHINRINAIICFASVCVRKESDEYK